MPRPFNQRRVCCNPNADYFKPRGVPVNNLEVVNLTVDEFEAVRLADLEAMYQEEAASKMKVSRQTFGNIIKSAHQKIADAIINAKAIEIRGGVYKMISTRKFECYECGHKWEVPCGTSRPDECPACKSKNIHRAADQRGCGKKKGRSHGHTRCGTNL